MTRHRAFTQAIRRRMALTGEKYTEARRALERRGPMAARPVLGVSPTVLAEGRAGDWPWVLEASSYRDVTDHPVPGAPSVVYRVRAADSGQGSWSGVHLGDFAVVPRFFQEPEGDASVLSGPVAREVEAAVVEPVFPIRGPVQHASVVSAAGLGCFFVIAFAERVEQAEVRVEPRERFAYPTRPGFNIELQDRRRSAESVELGRGPAPDGGRWRLRAWRALPDELRVDLLTADDDARIDAADRIGASGSGYGGPLAEPGEVIACRMMGTSASPDMKDIVGEIARSVERVTIRLDDGNEIDAQLVRTGFVENDYFVAFFPTARRVAALVARDKQNRVLGHQDVDFEHPGTGLSDG